ncbi:MAG TPA: hypothetical protein VJ692_01715 [Nitrospiraceae bacterium]|jgi:hypothetical protein|nr:hypothetical protein [Nitrospiraceae bacterium]
MYYHDDAIAKLAEGYRTLDAKLKNLMEAYVLRELKHPGAREYATQGFPRRLKTLMRCIENVFSKIPPERDEIPSRDELSDATIFIQAFVFNVFGCIDNLAWIWVLETSQKRKDGTPIPNSQIGLGKENISVRLTLSEEFQTYLSGLDDWFKHIGNLRHALVHRIPLYIPPYVIETQDEATYRELEQKMSDAVKGHDLAEYDRLSVEQLKLGRFRPWIQHSFEEKAKPIVFHAQMISDFNTVEELGRKMLEEMDKRGSR